MIRNTRDFKRSGESRRMGAAAVEMAVVAPVLVLILGGIIQFGGLFFLHNNMVNAAREAARALAVKTVTVAGSTSCSTAPPAGTAEEMVCDSLSSWGSMNFTLAACNPTVPGANCVAGSSDVAVEITVPLSEASLWDALGLFQTGNLEARVIMREEQ